MKNTITKISAIILAAGEAKRFGEPKQLLPWGNSTILGTVLDEFSKANFYSIIVVLGAYNEIIKQKLNHKLKNKNIVINENWQKGMFSSIIAGLKEAIKLNSDFALFHQGDMPFIKSDILNEFIKKAEKGKIIIATVNNRPAHPYLIHKDYFNEILNMDGKEGMRPFIRKYFNDAFKIKVPYKTGKQDIDTWDDYRRLKNGI